MSLRKKIYSLIPNKLNKNYEKLEGLDLKNKLAIVVHTCDSYEFCWRGWLHYFNMFWDYELPFKIYFFNEEVNVSFDKIDQIKTGTGEWSQRLRVGLSKIPEENILYLQEDVWLQSRIDIMGLLSIFLNSDIQRLQLSPTDKQYTLYGKFHIGDYQLRKFSNRSNYLISHQPSFWKKSFLLDSLLVDESPWDNEILETRRLRAKKNKTQIYLLAIDWYIAVSRKGKLTSEGLELERNIS